MAAQLDNQPVLPLPDTDGDGNKPLIEFRNVTFAYPARPNHQVLTDFNLTVSDIILPTLAGDSGSNAHLTIRQIYPGQFVAFVGESGSGKSTLVGLLERYLNSYIYKDINLTYTR
jgi:ATP-binding cassette subfamily B (MDR/TAP) protein 1